MVNKPPPNGENTMRKQTPHLQHSLLLAIILIGFFSTLFARHSHRTAAFDMESLWQDESLVIDTMPWRDKGTPFGMVATLGNRVRQDETDEIVGLLREAGVQWQREEIFWHKVQHAPDAPFVWTGDGQGFSNYDHAIESQIRAGIQVLGLLDYNPAWFKGQNPPLDAWIDDWGNFVYNTVARYGRDRGWITHWELWNEPNLAPSGYESGLYNVEDYVRILEVGSAAAKAADPNARIVLGGLAPTWTQQPSPHSYDYFEYLLAIAEAGAWNYIDIIAIHPYRPGPPEGFVEGRHQAMDLRNELRFLDRFLVRYGMKPVWITELGWSTHQASQSAWPAVDGDTQAFFLIRSYILAITHPSVEKIFWYDFRNDTDPADTTYTNPVFNNQQEQFHYGLLRRSYPLNPMQADLRKPSFLAYRTMTDMLAGLSPQHIRADGTDPAMPGVYWYRFASTTRRVDVIWRAYDTPAEIPLDCACQEAVVRNWKGVLQHIVYSGDGHISIALPAPGTPLYIEYDPPAAKEGQYFAATGHTLRGALLDFWQTNGGLYRFGYPLTEEIIEPQPGSGRPRIVQYFDRTRLEHYPEYSGTPYEVQMGNLGHTAMIQQPQQPRRIHAQPAGGPNETRFFAETGYSIAPPFRAIWEHHGGLQLIGYPISPPFAQTDPSNGRTYTVQYFERARIEHFPATDSNPAKVEFGLLGRELYTSWGRMGETH